MQFLRESQLYRLHFGLRLQLTITLVPKEICDWRTEGFVHCPDHRDEQTCSQVAVQCWSIK